MKAPTLFLIPLILSSVCTAGTFHVAAKTLLGEADGSPTRPYSSIAEALESGAQALRKKGAPLDEPLIIALRGGAVYNERLFIDPASADHPRRPIRIEGVGSERAILRAVPGASDALAKSPGALSYSIRATSLRFAIAAEGATSVYNRGNVTFENIKFEGSGMDNNTQDGINFYSDSGQYGNITIRNCEVSGFGTNGIVIGGWSGRQNGFKDILVESCEIHHNRKGGMFTYGEFKTNNVNLIVRGSTFHHNLGDPLATKNTGSGLVVSGVTGALIEHCVAYENGGRCTASEGPVGIWTYAAHQVVIQECEAYDNNTGGPADGGGFDLDGGSTECVIQYCYSHGNDGAGYLLAQYPGASAFENNTVRYNISHGDGGKNGYGGINFWATNSAGGIRNTKIHGNTIVTSSGNASSVRFMSGNISGVQLANNLFICLGDRELVRNPPSPSAAYFIGNAYWAPAKGFMAGSYASLGAWREAKGQEMLSGKALGYFGNPDLDIPTAPPTLGIGRATTTLGNYGLAPGSFLIDAGLDLVGMGWDVGIRDFLGNSIPQGEALDIGAAESLHKSVAISTWNRSASGLARRGLQPQFGHETGTHLVSGRRLRAFRDQ